MPARIALAALLLVALASTGCTQRPIDWPRTYAIAAEADRAAAVWQVALDPDDAAKVAEVREIGQPVLEALRLRAESPNAADPLDDLQAWLAIAEETLSTWPDERQRRIAAATLATVRMALALAGVPPASVPADEGGGA